MRIAAIDCGSNSFHLLIADAFGHDQMTVVEDDKNLLYLGAEVAGTGSISPASLIRAKRVMRHYKTLISRHNVEVIKCVATSAIISAENGAEVIEALSKTLGHPVRVISGEEEAETIFRAISAVSTLPESRILACDMGGGSLELMAGQRHGLEHAISVALGASRVARELNTEDPLTEKNITDIKLKCKKSFQNFSENYPSELFSHVVASSGTLTTLITMARASVDGYVSPPLSLITASAEEIREICEQIISLPPKKRKNLIGYDRDRDEFLPTAAVIALEICKLVSPKAPWMISPYALREGIVFKIADEHAEDIADQSEVARRTIDDLENRMSVFTPTKNHQPSDISNSQLVSHGRKVAEISSEIFEALSEVHLLPKNDSELLRYASRLHDIGETISHSKHDQHGAYILSSIPLVGFSPEDAIVLRGIIRWHRTRKPRISDRFVGRMTEKDFERALWLTAILRVADGADAGKSSAIDSISISVKPDVIFIRCRSSKDCELEMYSARRKRALLEEVSKRDVVIELDLSESLRVQD